jgi:Zn-dependent metalloprotease
MVSNPGFRVSAAASAPGPTIAWHERNGTPVFLIPPPTGGLPPTGGWPPNAVAPRDPVAVARAFIEERRGVFRLDNPAGELEVLEVHADARGMRHVKFAQVYRSLPVWAQEIVVHLRPDGTVYAVNGRYSPSPRAVDGLPRRVDARQARSLAEAHWRRQHGLSGPFRPPVFAAAPAQPTSATTRPTAPPLAEELVWIDGEDGTPYRAWRVELRFGLLSNWRYFVDGVSGRILQHYDTVNSDGPVTATGLDLNGVRQQLDVYQMDGVYWMLDTTRSIFVRDPANLLRSTGMLETLDARNKSLTDETLLYYVTSTDNTWADPAAVSAHVNARRVFDYYSDARGRQGIDDKGGSAVSVIHVLDREGQPMDNAFWTGALMVYGDGNQIFRPLGGALDVAAHEMTHGVVQHSVGLEYVSQSGALNESLADCFAAMVDRDDWRMAEDVVFNRLILPSGALRDLADPHNGGSGPDDAGWQPAHMNEYQDLPLDRDHGGVHVNSGIPNRACYLLSEAIGRDKAERIYYRVLDARYVNAQANFVDMRRAVIFAAAELYGGQSQEAAAAAAAFDGVGIFDDDGSQRPDPHDPLTDDSWVAAINADGVDNTLYIARPVIRTAADLVRITSVDLATDTSQPIAVFSAEKLVLFVDKDHNIRAVGLDGSNEQMIGNQGIWSSISASPDGTKLAITTTTQDGRLYVLDLPAQRILQFQLYYPTLQGPSYIVQFADALDWDGEGKHIVFDALSRVPVAGGEPISFWSINLLELSSGDIFPILANQPANVDIGNPSFAQSADSFIVFEYYDRVNRRDFIVGLDRFSGNVAVIEDNGSTIGYPSYSPDDSRIAFQREVDGDMTLWQLPLQPSRIHPAGQAEMWVVEAQKPEWLGFGSDRGPAIPVPSATPRPLPPTATPEPTTPRLPASPTPTPTTRVPPTPTVASPTATATATHDVSSVIHLPYAALAR